MNWPRCSLRSMLLALTVAAGLAWIFKLAEWSQVLYVDSTTGSVKRTRTGWLGQVQEEITYSPIYKKLVQLGQQPVLRWKFVSKHSSSAIADAVAPPIFDLSSAQQYLVDTLSNDELLVFWRQLETNSFDQQEPIIQQLKLRYPKIHLQDESFP